VAKGDTERELVKDGEGELLFWEMSYEQLGWVEMKPEALKGTSSSSEWGGRPGFIPLHQTHIFFFETGSCYVVQAGLELAILLGFHLTHF
jgi:hypothetical protein